VGSIVAWGASDSIGCRFVVNGVVKAGTIAREVDVTTVCPLKAA
jgi:Mycobacterium membrane protein